MWEKTAVSFVYEYHFPDVGNMIPMDIKKAQFRIEHLTGYPADMINMFKFGTANMGIIIGMAKGK